MKFFKIRKCRRENILECFYWYSLVTEEQLHHIRSLTYFFCLLWRHKCSDMTTFLALHARFALIGALCVATCYPDHQGDIPTTVGDD